MGEEVIHGSRLKGLAVVLLALLLLGLGIVGHQTSAVLWGAIAVAVIAGLVLTLFPARLVISGRGIEWTAPGANGRLNWDEFAYAAIGAKFRARAAVYLALRDQDGDPSRRHVWLPGLWWNKAEVVERINAAREAVRTGALPNSADPSPVFGHRTNRGPGS